MKQITLSDGSVYQVVAVSDTLVNMVREGVKRKFREAGEPIDPPTYTVIGAGDVTHQEPHDETTLETDEDKATWKQHIDACQRMEVESNKQTMKAWLTGLKVELPEDDAWLQTQIWLGAEVPQKPTNGTGEIAYKMDLRFHYITTEVLRNPEDLFTTLNAIMGESYRGAVKEEDLEAAINSFRNNLQGKASDNFNAAEKSLEAQTETDGT